MIEKPKISVCVPVFQTERYLQQCIDSLMNQTMGGIEYIFVNDGSPDRCEEILRQNQCMYPDKIRVITHERNRGLGESRNSALQAANGEYISFVDSDDFIAPWMYETLYQNSVQNGADVTYIQETSVSEDIKYDKWNIGELKKYSPNIFWNPKLRVWDNRKLTEKGISDILAYTIGHLFCGLWKRSLIEKSGVSFPKYRYEDNYFASLVKCYLNKIAFVPTICYFYRYNPNSTVHARNKSYQLDRIQIEKMLLAEVKKRGLFEKYYAAWEYIYTFRYAYNTSMKLLSTFDNPPMEIIEQIWRNLEREFPNWEKNPYYRELIDTKERQKYFILKKYPRLAVSLYPYFKRLKTLFSQI